MPRASLGRVGFGEVLREEFVWRLGIKWFAGCDLETPRLKGRRGDPPYILMGAQWGEHRLLPNGNYLIFDTYSHQVIEVTPEYEIVGAFGEFNVPGSDLEHLNQPRGGDYNPETNRVLISDVGNGRVLEVDWATKKVVNVLTQIGDKTPTNMIATYNPFTGNIIVAARWNHYVAEVDWQGNEVWSFGEWNVAGSDESHLNHPVHAEVTHDNPDYVCIADMYNDRGLEIDKRDNSISELVIIPDCTMFKKKRYVYLLSGEFCKLLLADTDNILWQSWWIGPWFPDITHEHTILASSHQSVLEVDPRIVFTTYRQSHVQPLTRYDETKSLGAGETFTKPFIGLGYEKVTVFVKSTQAATMDILILDPVGEVPWQSKWANLGSGPPPNWEEYDSGINLPANEMVVYPITNPTGIMAVRVTMGGTAGAIKGWVTQEVY